MLEKHIQEGLKNTHILQSYELKTRIKIIYNQEKFISKLK